MNGKTIASKATPQNTTDSTEWMDISALQKYLPSHPPITRIYKWIHFKKIPYYKAPGTQLIHFLKSEIDAWLKGKEVGNG